MAATQRQAATSGVFLSRFHFGPLSKKHVSRDACYPTTTTTITHLPFPITPPPQHPPPTFQLEGGEEGEGERGGRAGGDHPHWDHSPSIRPFHTL